MERNELIGTHVNELNSHDIDWGTSYPTVDRETMLITGIVDGNYPEEYNEGNWTTATLIDGQIVTGEHYSDFVVATEPEID